MAIIETTFEAKQYVTLRKSISTSQITDKQIYDEAGKKLGEYMTEHNLVPVGPWSVLYFMWDAAGEKADIGIAFPVTGLGQVEDAELSKVEIPECKAAMDVLYGAYEGLGAVHQGLMHYVAEKGYSGRRIYSRSHARPQPGELGDQYLLSA